jgi:hypothetical protein
VKARAQAGEVLRATKGCRAEARRYVKDEKKKQIPRRYAPRNDSEYKRCKSLTYRAEKASAPTPEIQAAGLRAAATRTHPSERVGHPKSKSRSLDSSAEPDSLGMTAFNTKTTERFFDFALNFVDPAKAHPVGDFRRKKEIVRTRFPEAKGSGRCAQNDN